jgi:hypothetical protein
MTKALKATEDVGDEILIINGFADGSKLVGPRLSSLQVPRTGFGALLESLKLLF